MSHDGLAHGALRATHIQNQTPGRAIVVTGTAAVLPVAVLAARGASGLDVYGWMGSLATYGFIVAYALVCIALPRYLRDHGVFRYTARIISLAACVAMVLALLGNLYPVPEGPYWKAAARLSRLPGCGTALVQTEWKQSTGRRRLSKAVSAGSFAFSGFMKNWPHQTLFMKTSC